MQWINWILPLAVSVSLSAAGADVAATRPVGGGRPAPSWAPPPEQFAADEWVAAVPSWARTRSERGGTVVWFFKEMTQQEALPVLLRVLDHGETWLQTQAVTQLQTLSVSFPEGFQRKVELFYQSIDLAKLPADVEHAPQVDRDRLTLKCELAMLIARLDPPRGREVLDQLARAAPQQVARRFAQGALRQVSATTTRSHVGARMGDTK